MHLAEERQHVVLAKRKHLDVFHDHHLVVVHSEKCIVEDLFGILLIALGEKLQRLVHSLGGAQEAFAVWIFPQTHEELTHQFGIGGAAQSNGFSR